MKNIPLCEISFGINVRIYLKIEQDNGIEEQFEKVKTILDILPFAKSKLEVEESPFGNKCWIFTASGIGGKVKEKPELYSLFLDVCDDLEKECVPMKLVSRILDARRGVIHMELTSNY